MVTETNDHFTLRQKRMDEGNEGNIFQDVGLDALIKKIGSTFAAKGYHLPKSDTSSSKIILKQSLSLAGGRCKCLARDANSAENADSISCP